MSEKELIARSNMFELKSYQDAIDWATRISKTNLCPTAYKNKPDEILVCMQMGYEVRMPPLAAMQNIAVINGRPSLYGDGIVAVCRSSPDWEYMTDTLDETTMTHTCTVKRKNEPEHKVSYSQADAVKAGLWGKSGPWSQYPKRMLMWRARSYALRDVFADALRGLVSEHEARDLEDKDYSHVRPTTIEGETVKQNETVRLIDETQKQIIIDKAQRAGSKLEDISKHYEVESVDKLTVEQWKRAIQSLDKKIGQQQAAAKLKEMAAAKNVKQEVPKPSQEEIDAGADEVAEFWADVDKTTGEVLT